MGTLTCSQVGVTWRPPAEMGIWGRGLVGLSLSLGVCVSSREPASELWPAENWRIGVGRPLGRSRAAES